MSPPKCPEIVKFCEVVRESWTKCLLGIFGNSLSFNVFVLPGVIDHLKSDTNWYHFSYFELIGPFVVLVTQRATYDNSSKVQQMKIHEAKLTD